MSKSDFLLDDGYSIKVVTDLREFETLRDVWDSLAEKHVSYFPFLCFDWFRIWLNHFLGNHQLFILLLCNRDEIEMIAPLIMKEEKVKGIQVTKIELIGNVYSPIRDFLFKTADSKVREQCLTYLFEYLFKHHQRWDIVDLNSISEYDDGISIVKKSLAKCSLKYTEFFCFGNWFLDGIDYSSNTYIANLSRKWRKSIRLDRNRMLKEGKVNFKMITNCNEVVPSMESYFEVYAKSWKKRESLGNKFHLDLAKQFAENGWMRLGFVFLESYPLAAGFVIVYKDCAYFVKMSYDDNYKHLGPGSIWLLEMITCVIDEDKVKVLDFLKGDESYKTHWVTQRRERKSILVYNVNLKGKVLHLLIQKILPFINKNHYLSSIKTFFLNRLHPSGQTITL